MLNVLDLFSGIGGFTLGLERTGGFRTVAFCEIDPFCRRVLAKHWPGIPIWRDIRKLRGFANIDVICGGFPCQDISNAGKHVGIKGERSGLWSEFARLIGGIRPRYVIVENVAALLGRGLGQVLGDLATLGYDAEWHCIPASYVGAPHIRDRVWIVAAPNIQGNGIGSIGEVFAGCALSGGNGSSCWREAMPAVSRMGDGIPGELDRLAALGNAVVPQIPEIIGRAILEAERLA